MKLLEAKTETEEKYYSIKLYIIMVLNELDGQ